MPDHETHAESKLTWYRTVPVPTTISEVSTILHNLTITESVPTTLFSTETRVENAVVLSTTTQVVSFTTTSTSFVSAGQVVTSTTTQIRPTTYTIFSPAVFNITGKLHFVRPRCPFPGFQSSEWRIWIFLMRHLLQNSCHERLHGSWISVECVTFPRNH